MTTPTSGQDRVGFDLTVAQSSARDGCLRFLSILEKQVNELSELIDTLRRGGFDWDDPKVREAYQRAAQLLTDINRTVAILKECARVDRDGMSILTEAEKELIRRLMDRARKAAESGGLPIPDQLYFKARQGDPDAIRRLEDFLKAAGNGARRGAEITAEFLLLLIGLMGALGRKPAF